MPPRRTQTLATKFHAITLEDGDDNRKKKRKRNNYPMLGPKRRRKKRTRCTKASGPEPPEPEPSEPHSPVPNPPKPTPTIKPEPPDAADSSDGEDLFMFGLSAQERSELERKPSEFVPRPPADGGLTLDRMPYDVLYLIIKELCKPIPLRSDLLQDHLAPCIYRMGGFDWENETRLAIRHLRALPFVCKAFYEPAMASIYRYIPFSFHFLNIENWSSLAKFWSRQENRPVMDRIQRLHVVLKPKLLDCWNFDSRYADELDVKNHLDGVRQLTKVLSSSLTDLPELKELDISIVNDGDALGRSPCDMQPSWNLLTSLESALTNRFDNLTTLGLKAPAYDLASLLQSASPELCTNLRSFCCTLSSFDYWPEFKSHENPTESINAFVKSCPNLVSLSLPYLCKGLRLHPDNTGLKELSAFEDGPDNPTRSYFESSYLELFPVLMSKTVARIELWNVEWASGTTNWP
ncbi:hypothetical protein QBC32DRAFT_9296 [Pseudoneurospora amorphoporcata]|uniref:F-box domain-containing protein n=1 Tax=Pseudoneurospora amorphoporcata TaxID=241081 RepID=A0AAN6P1A0_9PEZI|nr:hypothetical protein QBC32DRAFT_9296 [Pseudoneurospora amorphoporcata]